MSRIGDLLIEASEIYARENGVTTEEATNWCKEQRFETLAKFVSKRKGSTVADRLAKLEHDYWVLSERVAYLENGGLDENRQS